MTILRADDLIPLPWLVHGFSTRQGGKSQIYGGNTLNLGYTKEDSRSSVEANRSHFFKSLDPAAPSWPLTTLRQIHSDLIHCISRPSPKPLAGDGLITAQPGLFLGILTADCLPVIVADSKNKVIGIFHAGWRGTLKRIVEKGIAEMQRVFGTSPDHLKAAIGPGIHRCCYEVGAEVREQFHSQFDYAGALFEETENHDPVHEKYPLLFMTARPPGHGPMQSKISLDLVTANRRQLLNAGVAPVNISASPLCTSCRTDMLFSYRAEHGVTGRMLAVAAIRA